MSAMEYVPDDFNFDAKQIVQDLLSAHDDFTKRGLNLAAKWFV